MKRFSFFLHSTLHRLLFMSFFKIMISLKLSNNSEWQGLRGNKNFPQNNLHANLKLVMSADGLWATCEVSLSHEHITLPRHTLLDQEHRMLSAFCYLGAWQRGDYQVIVFLHFFFKCIEWSRFYLQEKGSNALLKWSYEGAVENIKLLLCTRPNRMKEFQLLIGLWVLN